MSNLGLERHLASLGLTLERTAVGDRYVLERMREQGYNVGGEQSGHVILSDYATTGDGLVTAMQVLAVVKKLGRPRQRSLPLLRAAAAGAEKRARARGGAARAGTGDRGHRCGAKRRLGEAGRLVIRPSGTEPVIRVMGEGDDSELVEGVVDDICDALSRAAEAA